MLAAASISYAPTVRPATRASMVKMQEIADKAGLQNLAQQLNPVVGFWDPLSIVDQGDELGSLSETIGWFRHAEIKHGRVAMAAFVGYCVQANGIYFPWKLTGGPSGITHEQISQAGSPAEQWDALPFEAKCQIIAAIGTFELIGEYSDWLNMNGEKHYVRGGKPGYYPPFKGIFKAGLWPHPLPYSLYDPAGISKKRTAEQKERGLLVEINNGRLAMLGIFGFLSESKIPGSVPALSGIIKPYAGEYMAPFTDAASSTLYQ
jgi:hypothetical protein